MTIAFDQHGINDMTVAISREMSPQGSQRARETDTLFMGGPLPTDEQRNDLAGFGLRKNYNVVFPTFDVADSRSGPTGFHAVVTDGIAESFILSGGRLWKRDRRSPAVLLFPGANALIRMSGKGRLVVRDMKGRYHDHGHELAREAVLARAAARPGHIPVVTTIGAASLPTVLDMKAFAATFEVAG